MQVNLDTSISVKEVTERINAYKERNKLTQKDIANAVNINQSQVSRILNGEFKRISKNVQLICEYAKIELKGKTTGVEPSENEELMSALKTVWNGKNTKALAKVIRSLRDLQS